MRRLAAFLQRRWIGDVAALGVQPYWLPGAGWKWRVVMALRALAGDELGGWR